MLLKRKLLFNPFIFFAAFFTIQFFQQCSHLCFLHYRVVLFCILHSIQSPHDLVMSTPDQTQICLHNFLGSTMGVSWLTLWFLLLVSQGSQVVEMWCCESSGYLITWFGDHYPGFRILGICLLLHISNYFSFFCVWVTWCGLLKAWSSGYLIAGNSHLI